MLFDKIVYVIVASKIPVELFVLPKMWKNWIYAIVTLVQVAYSIIENSDSMAKLKFKNVPMAKLGAIKDR